MERAKLEAGIAAWPHILPPDVLPQLAFPERWSAAVTRPPARGHVLVGELEAKVVGFAMLRPSGDDDADGEIGELDGFYVVPDAWGRGVGRALMSETLERLRADGFREATLWTAVENHRPRRIYELGGWRLDGTSRHRQIFGAEFEEVRYRIRL